MRTHLLLRFALSWVLLSLGLQGVRSNDILSFDDDSPPIRFATFKGKDLAWIVTNQGALTVTSDSGEHWDTIPNTKVDGFRPLSFYDQTTGWMVGRKGNLWKTLNGGKEWSIIGRLMPHRETGFYTRQLYFLNASVGWAIELPRFVSKTEDGGKSWQGVVPYPKLTVESLVCLQFLDPNWGWIGGSEGLLLHTEDGGRTWQKGSSSLSPASVQKIQFVDKKFGWVIAGGEVFSSKDGGIKWKYHLLDKGVERRPEILSLFFLDKNNGWVVGVDRQNSPPTVEINQLKGITFHTKNGGESWERVSIATETSLLTKIYFADDLNGWLTSRNAVYLTHNSGKTWERKLKFPSE